ncbi:MAG: response regulator [Balneolales bacterium]
MPDKSILIVEDEFLVGLYIQSTLKDAGFAVTAPAVSVKEALHHIAEEGFDAAVLDINLGEETSEEIAVKLSDLKIPFVFVTGYEHVNLSPQFAGSPLLEKPIEGNQLVDTIHSLCS